VYKQVIRGRYQTGYASEKCMCGARAGECMTPSEGFCTDFAEHWSLRVAAVREPGSCLHIEVLIFPLLAFRCLSVVSCKGVGTTPET
jgi:hypothetical protein